MSEMRMLIVKETAVFIYACIYGMCVSVPVEYNGELEQNFKTYQFSSFSH